MNAREHAKLIQTAEAHFRAGRPEQAKRMLRDEVAKGAASAKAYELLGYIYGNEGNLEQAYQSLHKAGTLPGHSAESLYYLGVSCLKLDRPGPAIEAFDRALSLAGDFFAALHDRGTAYSMLQRYESALESYLRALAFDQASFDLLFNLGKVYEKLGESTRALSFYERALAIRPDSADVWAHVGAIQHDRRQLPSAIGSWERALALDPQIEFLPGFLMMARLRLCDWSLWGHERLELIGRVERALPCCGPFEILALSGSASVHQESAQSWVVCNHSDAAGAIRPEIAQDGRIRLGYCSADFGEHAVSCLTAEIYELHDRSRFEVFAFSFGGAAQGSPMRERLVEAFDHFVDLSGKPDAEAVQAIRALGIAIAIDLGGHTQGGRTALFQSRIAPIQVNYVGYPGTMGVSCFDYMIADEVVVPTEKGACYMERLVYLPRSFQPSDRKRKMSADFLHLSRRELGLPELGFVFCCFNNSFKINPDVFGVWMRILARVEGSCLWLLADFDECAENLRSEAEKRGIDRERLVFGRNLPQADYLSRYCHADLFLDTLPFNGGATANDALWAGVPVITRPGDSFASRMAASLLSALDLNDLIVDSDEAYESLAVHLASSSGPLQKLKTQLAHLRDDGELFCMPQYVHDLEAAFSEMHRRHAAGDRLEEDIHVRR